MFKFLKFFGEKQGNIPIDNLDNLNWGVDSDFYYVSGNIILFL